MLARRSLRMFMAMAPMRKWQGKRRTCEAVFSPLSVCRLVITCQALENALAALLSREHGAAAPARHAHQACRRRQPAGDPAVPGAGWRQAREPGRRRAGGRERGGQRGARGDLRLQHRQPFCRGAGERQREPAAAGARAAGAAAGAGARRAGARGLRATAGGPAGAPACCFDMRHALRRANSRAACTCNGTAAL